MPVRAFWDLSIIKLLKATLGRSKPHVNRYSLTASERRSLLALKIPAYLQSESALEGHSAGTCDRNRDTLLTRILHRLRLFSSGSVLIPVLEGKVVTRDQLNPRAIVAVGEFESFVHIPGVGTHWQVGSRQGKCIERKCLYRQLCWLIFAILQPTRARKEWNHRWRDYSLPCQPLPFSQQVRNDCFCSGNKSR